MTKQTTIAVACIAAAMLAAPNASIAQGRGMGMGGGAGAGPVATACKSDIAKYCSKLKHGRGEVRACLNKNRAKVSRECRYALDNTGGGRGGGWR